MLRHLRLLPLILVLLLLAACRNAQQPSPEDGPQILATLPQGWTPVTVGTNNLFSRNATIWTPINIDDDAGSEYLLYFTYDNGQVGAIIYDQQTGPSGVVNTTPVPAPIQPTGSFVSYQVEPSNWTRGDAPDTVGFIAPPFTDPQTLRLVQVQRFDAGDANAAGTANSTPPEGAPPTNEAIIFGGDKVITVLWWRNAFNGYGITQMSATGGMQAVPPVTGEIVRPLQTAQGQTPETGLLARSVICRAKQYVRTDANEPSGVIAPIYQSAVRYVESDLGLRFCFDPPPYPYYPEGVVLAFLRPPPAAEPARGAQAVTPGQQYLWADLNDAQRATINALVTLQSADGSTGVQVRELRAPASVALPPDMREAAGPPITTSVCAEIVSLDGTQFRRLLFNLLYNEVQQSGGAIVPERFVITGVTDITTAVVNCARVVP
jgi:hypothetical protein